MGKVVEVYYPRHAVKRGGKPEVLVRSREGPESCRQGGVSMLE